MRAVRTLVSAWALAWHCASTTAFLQHAPPPSRARTHISRAITFPTEISANDVVSAANTAADGAGSVLAGFDVTTAGAVGSVATLFALLTYRAVVYWRMEYIRASFLTNRLPRVPGGADLLQLGAKDAKALYYLPSGVRRVVLSSRGVNEEIATSAAKQLGFVVSVRPQEGDLLDCPDGIIDCVYSVGGFGGAKDCKKLVAEAARVLKPKGTLLFVEKGDAVALVDEVRRRIGEVQADLVTNIADPYTVAMATKTEAAEASATAAKPAAKQARAPKGFRGKPLGQRAE